MTIWQDIQRVQEARVGDLQAAIRRYETLSESRCTKPVGRCLAYKLACGLSVDEAAVREYGYRLVMAFRFGWHGHLVEG